MTNLNPTIVMVNFTITQTNINKPIEIISISEKNKVNSEVSIHQIQNF